MGVWVGGGHFYKARGCIFIFIWTHWSNQRHGYTHTNLTLPVQMPSFPLTSPQSPETMTSSIGTLLRLSAGEITSHTEPIVLLFFWSYVPFFLFFLFFFVGLSLVFPNKWNHEGVTSKEGMFWKVSDEMKDWHDKHLGAMYCTFSSLCLVFCALTFFSHYILCSLGLIVFTSAIRVFCIILASTYLISTFDRSIATVTQCSLHSVML